MATLDKKALLNRRRSVRTEDVDLGDGTVTVRGLTRGEINRARVAAASSSDIERQAVAVENHYISAGMVAPEMSPAEVAEWLEHAPAGDGTTVMAAIQRLSGLTEGAPKSGDAGVRG